MYQLTIVICTHNRADILPECLESISCKNQDAVDSYEVLIVDNNSTDQTRAVSERFTEQHPNFKYHFEGRTGLSHARNAGYQNSTSPWVAYLDDDGLATTNFVSRCLQTIKEYDFDMFGGMYYPWHKYPKPKWLPDDFGQKGFVRNDVGLVPKKGSISGGIMAINKAVLEQVGGFSSHFGMVGDRVAYGEENELEERLLKKGYKIGFDPEWQMDHLVANYKLNLGWHLKMSFSHGRDSAKLYSSKKSIFHIIMLLPLRFCIYLIKDPLTSLFKYMTTKKYYWQNLLIDSYKRALWVLGEIIYFTQSHNWKTDQSNPLHNS